MTFFHGCILTLFRMGFFGNAHRWGGGGGGKKHPLSKICHTYPTLMKLDTVISYLKKIQKLHESRDTSAFSHRKPAIFSISGNAGVDCVLMHMF